MRATGQRGSCGRRDRPPLTLPERALLGLPSLVLGVVPLAAPRWTADTLGLGRGAAVQTVVRIVGARELVVAIAFLRGRSPRWLWGFVAQDATDLPVLVWLLVTGRTPSPRRLRRTCAAYALMAVVDVGCTVAQDLAGRHPLAPR